MTSSFNQNVRLPLCLRDASDLRPVAEEVLRLGLGLTHLYPYYRFLVPHAYCYHIFYLYTTKPLSWKKFIQRLWPRFGLSSHLSPRKPSKKKQGQRGLIRWVIERTNSWMERCKSLVKNFERTLENATTKINLCFVRLMLKILALAEDGGGSYIAWTAKKDPK